jgi:hypothetical protein
LVSFLRGEENLVFFLRGEENLVSFLRGEENLRSPLEGKRSWVLFQGGGGFRLSQKGVEREYQGEGCMSYQVQC